MKIGLIILLLIIGLTIAPFLFIWSVNTIFGASIEHSLINYFASFILLALVRGGTTND